MAARARIHYTMKESKLYLWYAPEKYNTFTRRSELDLILDFCFGASRSTATLCFVCRHSVSAFAHFPTNRNLVAAIPLVHRFCPRKDRFKIWRPSVFKHTCKKWLWARNGERFRHDRMARRERKAGDRMKIEFDHEHARLVGGAFLKKALSAGAPTITPVEAATRVSGCASVLTRPNFRFGTAAASVSMVGMNSSARSQPFACISSTNCGRKHRTARIRISRAEVETADQSIVRTLSCFMIAVCIWLASSFCTSDLLSQSSSYATAPNSSRSMMVTMSRSSCNPCVARARPRRSRSGRRESSSSEIFATDERSRKAGTDVHRVEDEAKGRSE